MATTPEGRTKARIKRLLVNKGVWFFMPVQSGYGSPELDFVCGVNREYLCEPGREERQVWELFFIEAKAHGENPTARQKMLIDVHRAAGRKVFIIDDEHDSLRPKHDSLKDLDKWLRGY